MIRLSSRTGTRCSCSTRCKARRTAHSRNANGREVKRKGFLWNGWQLRRAVHTYVRVLYPALGQVTPWEGGPRYGPRYFGTTIMMEIVGQ
jgi:hypothetical protein